MPFGGGGGANKEAKKARQDEEARAERIRQGTERINSIFNGSNVGTGSLIGSMFDPTKTYYTKEGAAWSPTGTQMVTVPGGPGTPQRYEMVRRGAGKEGSYEVKQKVAGTGPGSATKRALTPEEEWRAMQGELYGGVQHQGGFGDDFFGKRRQAYIDYASPQLEDQFGDANKELTFSLDRSGLLNSSVRGEKSAELTKLFDINKQKVADDALSYETQARNSVEDARAGLISTLNATGDAEGAANAAIARATALSQPTAFSPISNLFADFTAGLGSQAAIERANAQQLAAGNPGVGRYNTGLFGNTKSVAVGR